MKTLQILRSSCRWMGTTLVLAAGLSAMSAQAADGEVRKVDMAQGKAEADVNLAIQETQTRINEAQAKRKKFETEAEFYKKKTMPAELTKELRTLDHEIKTQQELLDVKKREFDAIKAKYDADRKRYYEVTKATPMAAPSGGAAKPR